MRRFSSYTNITLRGTTQAAVEAQITALRQTAFLSPTAEGFTVVYPETQADWLAARLSQALEVTALVLEAGEGPVFRYALFESGEETDGYEGAPGWLTGEESPPLGGDAARLATALGDATTETAAELERILSAGPLDEVYGYALAEERHQEIADLLRLPAFSIGAGFASLEAGHTPEGLDSVTSLTLIRPATPLPIHTWLLVAPRPDATPDSVRDFLTGISDAEPLTSLGTADEIRAHLSAALPHLSHRGERLIWEADDFSLDFSLPTRQQNTAAVMVTVATYTKPLSEIAETLVPLCFATGWFVVEGETGTILAP